MKTSCIILFALFLTIVTHAQSESVVKCNIWKPASACDLPKSLNVPTQWSCRNCFWTYKECEKINKKSWTGVWLTFNKETDSTFYFKSHYKNISLTNKKTNKIIHPKAIAWYPICMSNPNCDLEFMPKSLRTKEFIVNFKPKTNVDLILIFDSAEPGDKLIIDNFIEAEIQ